MAVIGVYDSSQQEATVSEDRCTIGRVWKPLAEYCKVMNETFDLLESYAA